MFEINNTKTFKDSVHGYVEVPKCFVEYLMDNEYFQRLRNIEQTGMRVLYPNAKHDRFSHSLGVFHLGHRAVDALLDNFSKDQYWNIESDNQSILYWAKNKILFLIACLLHDIGHAPFSHALESQMLYNSCPPIVQGKRRNATAEIKKGEYITNELKRILTANEKNYMLLKYEETGEEGALDLSKVAPHEQIGALLIFNDFFRDQIIHIFDSLHDDAFPCPEGESILYAEYYQDKVVLDKVDKNDEKSMVIFGDDLCFIARMIMGLKYDDWRPERQIRNCFIELLNGQNFDVDKLDYIVRDTQMSGIHNISLDVDRLLSSLCIVTKTKYLNKIHLQDIKIRQMTVLNIHNFEKNSNLNIEGIFHGTLIIPRGTEVVLEENSKIESLTSISHGEVKIRYKTAARVDFAPDAIVKQDSEILQKIDSGDDDDKLVIHLDGNGVKPFGTYIENALLLNKFNFVANEDVKLKIHEYCKISICGPFYSEGSIRLFGIDNLSGNISEVEILSDAFKQSFTKIKVPGKDGYNTFTIGFKKKAINVIANVMDARNNLYLWIYAHHKVIYYANFLIPILAKELFPERTTDHFPNWSLDFNNIKYLDDAYIWTVIKYKQHTERWTTSSKHKEISALLDELATRNYKKSLYKSLAEYDLYFEKYDEDTKRKLQEYIRNYLINVTNKNRPFIDISTQDDKRNVSVGYFKKTAIGCINQKLKETINQEYSKTPRSSIEYHDLEVTELVYVSVEYQRKQLETLNTFIDMKDDIIPISQIPLLETQTQKSIPEGTNHYFYLYYQTNSPRGKDAYESELVKIAVKHYFDDLIESKIK